MADTTLSFESCVPERALGVRNEDSALLAGLRRGEEAAYETLISRYEEPVYSIVSRLVDDPSDAPDVVQEVFLKVFRKVDGFREESSLKTWIYRIAVNEARNHHRWFSRRRWKETGIEPASAEQQGPLDWMPDPGPSPFDVALDHETATLLEEALAKVSPNFRAALVLREIEGFSYEEIAEILEISLGTVKSRILRGRESLRKHLAERLRAAPSSPWPLEFGAQRTDAV